MVKILITGANGYIGSRFCKMFDDSNIEYTAITRKDLDLRNENGVTALLDKLRPSHVLHFASIGVNNFNDIHSVDNILMFNNFAKNRYNFGTMWNFGSGAEFDTRCDISNYSRYDLGKRIPFDYYGLSKYVIGKTIIDIDDNIVNRRIFGVFDEYEENRRLIKSFITNYIRKESMTIHQNRVMDFIHMSDLFNFIKNEMQVGAISNHDMNMVYPQKYSILDIARIINELDSYKVNIIIEKEGMGKEYTGAGNYFISDALKLRIRYTYEKLKEMIA